MSEITFNPMASLYRSISFLDNIWDNCKERFTEDALEEFGLYMSILTGDPGTFEEWQDAYYIAFGKCLSNDSRMASQEIYTTMLMLCARYCYYYQFNLFEVLNRLFLIRLKPDEHKTEWK